MVDHGKATVTTAGTAVAFSTTSQPCSFITIYPSTTTHTGAGNTGQVRIGGLPHAADSGAIPAGNGIPLNPGDAGVIWAIPATNGFNLNEIYVDADNNGDGVQFLFGAR